MDDGSLRKKLDTRTGETAWTEFAYRYFEFQNDTAYQYYRFYCTSLNAADKYLFLGELEFYYVASATAPVVTDGGAAVSGTSATITGSLDALGAGASSATVTLEYGTTAALGSSATVGTYADATDPISATLTGLSYGTTYYYAFKASTTLRRRRRAGPKPTPSSSRPRRASPTRSGSRRRTAGSR